MDAAVIAKPDLEAGEVPQAFVVLKKDQKVTVDGILKISILSYSFTGQISLVGWRNM